MYINNKGTITFFSEQQKNAIPSNRTQIKIIIGHRKHKKKNKIERKLVVFILATSDKYFRNSVIRDKSMIIRKEENPYKNSQSISSQVELYDSATK
jgi:hypothetical protein